jgi:hypothetical protein
MVLGLQAGIPIFFLWYYDKADPPGHSTSPAAQRLGSKIRICILPLGRTIWSAQKNGPTKLSITQSTVVRLKSHGLMGGDHAFRKQASLGMFWKYTFLSSISHAKQTPQSIHGQDFEYHYCIDYRQNIALKLDMSSHMRKSTPTEGDDDDAM